VKSIYGEGSTFEFCVIISRPELVEETTEQEIFEKKRLSIDKFSPQRKSVPQILLNHDDSMYSISIPSESVDYTIDKAFSPRPNSARRFLRTSPRHSLQTKRETLQPKCQCPQILVVDDNIFNIVSIQSMLKSVLITSDSASNGEEAIKRLAV